ncbi:hypothetical protein CYQ11_19700 [Streptomyces cinnamoneus]|nr:hypothetical protein CYQ11_19700 [Streptomyces cinnamoneus]
MGPFFSFYDCDFRRALISSTVSVFVAPRLRPAGAFLAGAFFAGAFFTAVFVAAARAGTCTGIDTSSTIRSSTGRACSSHRSRSTTRSPSVRV